MASKGVVQPIRVTSRVHGVDASSESSAFFTC